MHLVCYVGMPKVTFFAGWYASTSAEIRKIKKLFNKMFGMLPNILAENRIFTDLYLGRVWKSLFEVIAAVEYRAVPDGLRARFALYVKAEEKRLQANLNDIRYDIDELDALNLVTGPGRIERVSPDVLINCCYLLSSHSTSFRL